MTPPRKQCKTEWDIESVMGAIERDIPALLHLFYQTLNISIIIWLHFYLNVYFLPFGMQQLGFKLKKRPYQPYFYFTYLHTLTVWDLDSSANTCRKEIQTSHSTWAGSNMSILIRKAAYQGGCSCSFSCSFQTICVNSVKSMIYHYILILVIIYCTWAQWPHLLWSPTFSSIWNLLVLNAEV